MPSKKECTCERNDIKKVTYHSDAPMGFADADCPIHGRAKKEPTPFASSTPKEVLTKKKLAKQISDIKNYNPTPGKDSDKEVMVVTEARKCGCVYERAEGVLIRRRYCKEHPAEKDTRPPFVVRDSDTSLSSFIRGTFNLPKGTAEERKLLALINREVQRARIDELERLTDVGKLGGESAYRQLRDYIEDRLNTLRDETI